MSRMLPVLILLLASGIGASVPHVVMGFEPDYDRAGVETWAWVPALESEEDPLTHQRIVNAVAYWMMLSGRREVSRDESPDVLLTCHSDSSDEVVVASRQLGYELGDGWRWTASAAGRDRNRYPKGSLVLDVWDAERGELVFRGAVTDAVSSRPPQPQSRIAEAVRDLVAAFGRAAARSPGGPRSPG